jgi:hypothetical protein
MRILSDNFIRKYLSCATHLLILFIECFETGITKIQSMKEDVLNASETHAVSTIFIPAENEEEEENDVRGKIVSLVEKTREETKQGKRHRGHVCISSSNTSRGEYMALVTSCATE